MQVSLKVKRFDPADSGGKTWWQEYDVDVHPDSTVLDSLIQVREHVDGTLALRCACRASICGSCGMKVNGTAKLVCKTRVVDLAPNGEQLTIEPMGNHHVIRDLVISLDTFFSQIKRVDPYLQPGFVPEQGEYTVSNESMENLLTSMNCIMCGCCVSDCTVLEVDANFIGPAAFAKAWRFTEDPRDSKRDERLKKLNDEDGGIWDCTRCLKCVEVCPKDVDPMGRIMVMRDLAMEAGVKGTAGSRHTDSFVNSVKRSGRLNETRLTIESVGVLNVPGQLAMAPVGVKALLKGKLPPVRDHNIPSKKAVREIVKKAEEKN
ncbi:MAG: succinate dehydrogenase/fumarate reductase iron-sulfur subunit [Chloroflexi bacterium]|nr:succinate dehydrogenase/fumarate reductase iron-sulfur subunit [Chloroflexota bacterium]